MKTILYLLLISGLLYSCASPPAPATVTDSITTTVAAPVVIDPVALPLYMLTDTVLSFSGTWVNEDYANKIREFKAPGGTTVPMESCIIIPERTLVVTRMIAGFYEGAADLAVGKDGEQYVLYSPELPDYQPNIIEVISPERIRIDTTYFIKIKTPSTNNSLNILEELLFAGNYLTEDGKSVTFTPDGQIKGLGKITYYESNPDYSVLEIETDINIVRLGQSSANMKDYAFTFDGDTLFIHKVECLSKVHYDAYCPQPAISDLVYTLVKQPS